MNAPASQPRPVPAHVLPFVAWVAVMALCNRPAAGCYAVRVAAGAACLVLLRPWQWYGPLRVRNVWPALLVGLGVFAVWIGPETRWVQTHWPRLFDAYRRFAVDLGGFGRLPAATGASPYAPGACGWPLTAVRLLGSALVIPVIEEFFWRGYAYRCLAGSDFVRVDLGRFAALPFLCVAVLFGLEHQRSLVGIAAGAAYGWLTLRTRDIWAAALAHATTNLLLGLFAITRGAYAFWG